MPVELDSLVVFLLRVREERTVYVLARRYFQILRAKQRDREGGGT